MSIRDGEDYSPGTASATLNVLMVAPNPFFVDRGFSVHVFEQARALRERGHNVAFAAYHCGRDPDGFRVYRSLCVPWYGAEQTGASLQRIFIDLLLFMTTLRALRGEHFDIVHGHIHEGAFIGLLCRPFTGCPVLLDMQGGFVDELTEKGFFSGVKKLLRPMIATTERWIVRRADAVIASSGRLANSVVGNLLPPPREVGVVMDGVDTDVFSPRPGSPELRRELQLPAGKHVVVFLGLLMPHQGIELLIEAAALALRTRDDHHYLIMGYPNVERYRDMVESAGVLRNCTFTGRVEYGRAPEYLALGDLAVSPKIGETEGNGKLFNYMAMGLATVSFDRAADREILGDTGLYAEPGDIAAFAAAIVKLLEFPDLRQNLGTAARRRAVENFSWHAVACNLEDHYRKMLASP
jgi:glycosyltransferase involved in cell wall biosynthesis